MKVGGGKITKIQIEIIIKQLNTLAKSVSDKIGQIFCKLNFNKISNLKNQSESKVFSRIIQRTDTSTHRIGDVRIVTGQYHLNKGVSILKSLAELIIKALEQII